MTTRTIDLAEAQRQLSAWLEASERLALGKSTRLENGREIGLSDSAEVLRMVKHWQRTVDRLRGRPRVSFTRPVLR